MANESSEAAREVTKDAYEPPELVVLGSVSELTAVVGGSVHDDESDRLLKANVEPVDRPLERLRAIRTEPAPGTVADPYEAPAIIELGSIAGLTAEAGDDSSLTPSDRFLKQDVEALADSLERLRTIRTRWAP